jgi:hypothetical protein
LGTDTVSAALLFYFICLVLCAICFFSLLSFFTVAFLILHSSWEQFPTIAWATPSFDFPQNMSETDNGQIVAAAAATQVKLCPYDEKETAIWFCLIETQFAAARIKWQKLRYTNAWPVCPSKSFWKF